MPIVLFSGSERFTDQIMEPTAAQKRIHQHLRDCAAASLAEQPSRPSVSEIAAWAEEFS